MSTNNPQNNSIGQRIRIARKNKGLTQEQLADNAKISKKSLENYEKDLTDPTGKIILDIAKLCDYNPNWLLTGQDPHPNNPKSKTAKTPEGLMTESQKDQMIETQGKLIKNLEAKIEELKGYKSDKKKS